jgi:hypothetical protein
MIGYGLLRVGAVAVCFSAAASGTSVTYTETASVLGGCTDQASGNPINLNGAGTCSVNTSTSILQTAWAVGAFSTSGAQMNGMLVTVTFSDATTQTLTWAATNTTAGGVSNTTGAHQWSLTENGDTFTSGDNFVLTNNATTAAITSIVLQGVGPMSSNCPTGSPASLMCGTIFDRVSPGGDNDGNEQTPGSHRGTDVTIAAQSGTANYTIAANYSNEYGDLSTNACNTTGTTVVERTSGPCADEWAKLTLTFTGATTLASGANISFHQDTDTTISSPEPSSGFLCGLSLLGALGCLMKRNRLNRVFAALRTSGLRGLGYN